MNVHVTTIGSALSGNKGAAAMLESSVQTVTERFPDARFTLLSMYPHEDQAQNPYPQLGVVPAAPRQLGVTINVLALLYRLLPPLRPLLEQRSAAIGALASSQVLLDQGGITFTDGREKFLLYNVASILPALLVGTPVVKCAQAVGPFRNPVNRLVAKALLPRVEAIVTRGARTHEFAEALGLRNLHRGADYAFLLELDGTEESQAAAHFDLSFFESPDTVVGVAPSTVLQRRVDAGGGDYEGEMVAFVDHLVAWGHRVLLAPHSVRTGTDKTHNNDLPLCRRINARLADPSSVLFVDRELPSQVLRWLIGRCDLFVTSRFHAMVSALAMQVPTLVIGWSHKYQEVLEMFELERWAFGHEELTPELLRQRFAELESSQDQVRAKLAEHLPEVRERSRLQVDVIADVIGSRLG